MIAVSLFIILTAIFILSYCIEYRVYAQEHSPVEIELSSNKGVLSVGEELIYNVSYSIFDLGQIKVSIVDSTSKLGKTIYRAKAYIDSYNGVPFVSLHQVFYSEVTKEPYSLFFSAHNTAKPNEIEYSLYSFDYERNIVNYEVGVKPEKKIIKNGEESVHGYQQDGLSLFYYARMNAREKKQIKTPIFINEKSFLTNFNFMNNIGSQKIDAVNYPIETVEFDGNANFIGIFGLTGYFQGYFSNDEQSIPIVAKMKVLVGSIHIELTKWNRPDWTPPKAKKK